METQILLILLPFKVCMYIYIVSRWSFARVDSLRKDLGRKREEQQALNMKGRILWVVA